MNCLNGTGFRCLNYFFIQGQICSIFNRGNITFEFKYIWTDFHTGSACNTGIINRYFRHLALLWDSQSYST